MGGQTDWIRCIVCPQTSSRMRPGVVRRVAKGFPARNISGCNGVVVWPQESVFGRDHRIAKASKAELFLHHPCLSSSTFLLFPLHLHQPGRFPLVALTSENNVNTHTYRGLVLV